MESIEYITTRTIALIDDARNLIEAIERGNFSEARQKVVNIEIEKNRLRFALDMEE